ncbi:hypothetical protein C8J57DRAFT_1328997, partial [Mycena rebaudengoi]
MSGRSTSTRTWRLTLLLLRGSGHLHGRVVVRALAAALQPLYSPHLSSSFALASFLFFFFRTFLPSPRHLSCVNYCPYLSFVLHSSSRSIAPTTHRSWSRPPAAARRPHPFLVGFYVRGGTYIFSFSRGAHMELYSLYCCIGV